MLGKQGHTQLNFPSAVSADSQPKESAERKKTLWVVVAIAIIALCMDALAVRSIVLLAPLIRSGFNLEQAQYGYMMAVIMGGTLLAVLPVGSLLDRLDPRSAIPIFLINVGIAFFVVSLQKSFLGLLATLFILGLLRAGIIPLVNRLITRRFTPAQRGTIMGIIYAAVPLGGFLGAIVLPALGAYKGWQSGYRLLGLIALFGGVISRNQIPKDEAVHPLQNPAHDLSLFQSTPFLILVGAYGFYALSLSAEVYVTLFLVDVVKLTALAAGIYFGLIQLSGVSGRLFWGFLADHRYQENRMRVLAIINWLTVISFILLLFLDSASKGWMIAIVMIAIGMSAASSWGILSAVLGDVVKVNSMAFATSVIFFITCISDVVGPILFGATLEWTQSYQKTLGGFIGVAVCTALTLTWMAWRGGLK